MCGIVGCFVNGASGLFVKEIDTVRDLVTADTVRGYHGTGLFFVKAEKDQPFESFYFKEATPGPALMETAGDWRNMLDGARLVVAHNRAATMGDIDEEHTHPFFYGPVIGVHNGTVRNWKSALAGHVDEAKMDSQGIYEALSKVGPDAESVTDLLAKLDVGAYSLVWWDDRTQTLRFARNSQRPMNIVLAERGFYFGSELRMLEWVLDRNNVKMKQAISTKTLSLIDVPLDGTPATVTSYEDKIPKPTYNSSTYYRGGQQAPVYKGWDTGWDDGWDDDWDDVPFGGWRTQQDSYYRRRAETPRKQLVTARGDIEVLELDGWTKSKVEGALRYMTGTSVLGQHRDMTFSQGLSVVFAKDTPDGKDSSGSAMPYAEVHIMDIWNNTFLAYAKLPGGHIEPATFLTPAKKHVLYEEIEDILLRGNEAVLNAPVIGVYAYACGMTAYAIGTGVSVPKMALSERSGVEAVNEAGQSELEFILKGHPEIAFRQSNGGWHFGWMNK